MKSKILFATVPADGHFNPLTSIAMHLKSQGHDVRWYTGSIYQDKLDKLGIQHYPFRKALDVNQNNIEAVFPERKKHKSMIGKLKFDLKHFFIFRAPEYFEDINDIYKEFPFDVLIADMTFTAAPLVREKLFKPVISIGVIPLSETSKDLPPYGMGMAPSRSFWGKRRQALLRFFSKNLLFKEAAKEMNKVFKAYGLKPSYVSVFDTVIQRTDLFLQSGVPGFEYQRSDMSHNIRFVGALLPYKAKQQQQVSFTHQDKLKRYKKVVLVTQGTVEKDPEKIIVPTLEALKNTPYLIIATTGGSQTKELQARYPQDNIIIEDFIDYNFIMPYAHVYVTDGGYGGVMLGIENKLPMVVAGIHEGKSEINARVGYFNLGINLGTERPTPAQIQKSVEEVMHNDMYRKNVAQLSEEFRQYDTLQLCEQYVEEMLYQSRVMQKPVAEKNSYHQHTLQVH